MPALVGAGLAIAVAPSEAAAQETGSRAEPHDIFKAEASFTSDYRYRGVSLTNRKPGVQANVTAAHENGLFADIAASTMAESEGGAPVELGFSAGYAGDHLGGSVDAYLTWYAYPGDSALDFAEANVGVSRRFGAFEPRAGLSYAPAQEALGDQDNVYAFVQLDYRIAETPVTIRARAGYENGALDFTENGGKWDWEAGAHVQASGVTLGLAYIDSDASVPDPRGRNLADATMVASLKIEF